MEADYILLIQLDSTELLLCRTYEPSVKRLGRRQHSPIYLLSVRSTWVRKLGPSVFHRQKDRSGHHYAWEAPESLVEDLRDMFRRGGGEAYGAVSGWNRDLE